MTQRIYLHDPYCAHLEAQILDCRPADGGYAAILDKTICYPRGGGQPCEPARLDDQPILDCYEDAGDIVHLLAGPIAIGPVTLTLDSAARLDHMAQHLGEHLLSRVIENRFGGKIAILRIEGDSSHIEIDIPLTPAQLMEAQGETNRIIAQNRPVRSILTTPQEAQARYGVPSAKAGAHATVRLVEIEDFDLNPCGGTHCRTTGEVAHLLICGAETVRGRFRIYFKCGGRAVAEHAARGLALLTLQQAFEAHSLPRLQEKALALLARKSALEAENHALVARLLALDTQRVIACAHPAGAGLFSAQLVEGGDAKHIKAVCDAATGQCAITLLWAVGAGDALSLIFARSKSKNPSPNLGALLRELAAAHGGKGGGSAVLAQGMMADTPQSRAAFEALAARVQAELTADGDGDAGDVPPAANFFGKKV